MFYLFDQLNRGRPTMARMIGKACPTGPGGRDCPCCGDAPGKPRKVARRTAKRSERQQVRREVRAG
jgi:hypothetical protein